MTRSFARSLEMLARARRVVPGASQTLSKGGSTFTSRSGGSSIALS